MHLITARMLHLLLQIMQALLILFMISPIVQSQVFSMIITVQFKTSKLSLYYVGGISQIHTKHQNQIDTIGPVEVENLT